MSESLVDRVQGELVVMVCLVLLIATSGAAHSDPVWYCGGKNVRADGGAVCLARKWKTAFVEDFESGLNRWRVHNFEGKLSIGTVTSGKVGKGLMIRNVVGGKRDTAFELASRPFVTAHADRFRLRFAWRANCSFQWLTGWKGKYLTQVEWKNAGGRTLGAVPFTLGRARRRWQDKQVEGPVPTGATRAVVRFGADQPNLAKGQFLALDEVRFEVRSGQATFESPGWILSRPLKVTRPARVSWTADTPPGTAVRLQVAGARGDSRGPGEWTNPIGPDGTPNSFFSSGQALPAALRRCAWLRYVARLETRAPARTPTLKRVSCGGAVDGPWRGLDTSPPRVVERSATRTADALAPIWFRLADNAGVDRRSIRVWLDGTDITRRLHAGADRYVYEPQRPLAPPPASGRMSAWRVRNYRRALTIERTLRRTPASPPGFHVTREAGPTDTAFALESPPLPVVPRARYRLSFWTRHSQDLRGVMKPTGAYPGCVFWLSKTGEQVGDPVPLDLGPAGKTWRRSTYSLVAPRGAWTAQVIIGFDTPNIGDGAFVDVAEVKLEGPRPRRPLWVPNLHRVTVAAADFAGNSLNRTWYLLVRPPRTHDVVTLRDDGMVLVDGRPFFPLGLYAVWKKPFNNNSFDKAFADLRAAGFNLAHTYSSVRTPDFAQFYAAAARQGIKLFVASNAGANCTDVDSVLADVVREEEQPALLAWYLADDTASNVGAEELRTVTDAIHDVDPAHPTVQADAVGGSSPSRYTNYVNATDGFLPELYPIRDSGARGVPQVIADMNAIRIDLREAGTRRKTVWPIIQYFQGWGWPRYPTKQELWAMSYLAIIHGANGITWYTYGGHGNDHGVTDYPDKWRNVCALAGELAQLQGALTGRPRRQPAPPTILFGPPKDALGFPSLSTLLKEHAGKAYLLTANSSAASVTAHFTAARETIVSLPFEKRHLLADARGFTDTFRPFAVHVYEWRL